QAVAEVDVILTEAAAQFVSPLTFQSVTGRRAYTEADLWGNEGHVLHIGLAQEADMMLIAPATANTMAKLAHGRADNLLSLSALAAECPLLVAPAMDGGMYHNPATQENIETLKKRGVVVIGPAEGHLASGLKATGRMVEPAALVGHIRLALGKDGALAGRKIVVSAGGTREAIDPVRYLGNRSSGRQGFALAQAALDLGAQVTLVAGPSWLETPVGAERVEAVSAEEMRAAVLGAVDGADALLMAAAVADYRPEKTAKEKIKKGKGIPEIKLTATKDILQEVAKIKEKKGFPKVTVGFAAESQDLLKNAENKLKAKKLDLIAVNDISAEDAGFEVETNQVTLLGADGSKEELPLMGKDEVAEAILERVVRLLE
ncbi:MAG: bifunctional phosphopantothenoylcysteine decarboxylase/phosphopantothenate--cysteine ligase CoaBC, partial [Anaerolineae bacterium]|nr:bifunctional phosphopantothenoylcysteine decarboxylase/phosphopantothenate--cysteine ligase CoaBC [Anaerolineae bacterium]